MKWGHWKVQDKFSFSPHCAWQIKLGGVTSPRSDFTSVSDTAEQKCTRISLVHDLTTATAPPLALPPHTPPCSLLIAAKPGIPHTALLIPGKPELGPAQLETWS